MLLLKLIKHSNKLAKVKDKALVALSKAVYASELSEIESRLIYGAAVELDYRNVVIYGSLSAELDKISRSTSKSALVRVIEILNQEHDRLSSNINETNDFIKLIDGMLEKNRLSKGARKLGYPEFKRKLERYRESAVGKVKSLTKKIDGVDAIRKASTERLIVLRGQP